MKNKVLRTFWIALVVIGGVALMGVPNTEDDIDFVSRKRSKDVAD